MQQPARPRQPRARVSDGRGRRDGTELGVLRAAARSAPGGPCLSRGQGEPFTMDRHVYG